MALACYKVTVQVQEKVLLTGTTEQDNLLKDCIIQTVPRHCDFDLLQRFIL